MSIPTVFLDAIQSPTLLTRHRGSEKTPQSVLLKCVDEDFENGIKCDEEDALILGLPAVPLVSHDVGTMGELEREQEQQKAQSMPTAAQRSGATLLPNLPDLVIKNTFLQCPSCSTCSSPELPRRRADSDWTGLQSGEAIALLDLGGSVELAEELGGRYMPGWTFSLDCEKAYEMPAPMTAPATAEKERRVDPDDGNAYTFAELQQNYSGRFAYSDVLEYWDCLEVSRTVVR